MIIVEPVIRAGNRLVKLGKGVLQKHRVHREQLLLLKASAGGL
jgi:hypothetical protein